MTSGLGQRVAIRLGVVDEPELVTAGLRTMLAPHQERIRLEVLDGQAPTDGHDVVLVDPLSRDGDAVREVERVAALGSARVLVFTWDPRAAGMDRLLGAGAVGVLPKSASADELVAAVEAVGRGEQAGIRATLQAYPRLSQRESEVLTLICRGLSNLEIAAELYVSVNSVKTYIRQIYQKAGVTRRTQAVAWAHRHGLDG